MSRVGGVRADLIDGASGGTEGVGGGCNCTHCMESFLVDRNCVAEVKERGGGGRGAEKKGGGGLSTWRSGWGGVRRTVAEPEKLGKPRDKTCELHEERLQVSLCFEPSQPLGIVSGL